LVNYWDYPEMHGQQNVKPGLWAFCSRCWETSSCSPYPQMSDGPRSINTADRILPLAISYPSFFWLIGSFRFGFVVSHSFQCCIILRWKTWEEQQDTLGTDYRTNAQIAQELKITQILYKLMECKRNWIQRVNRMPRNGLRRVMKHYCPTGRGNHGRLLKRHKADNLTTILCRCHEIWEHEIWEPYLPGTLWAPPGL